MCCNKRIEILFSCIFDYKFGEKIGPFLDKEGAKWSIIIAATIILISAGVYFLFIK